MRQVIDSHGLLFIERNRNKQKDYSEKESGVNVVFLFEVGWKYGYGQRGYVEKQVAGGSCFFSESYFKSPLYISAKKIEREHIEDKVHVVGMQYAVGEETIPY